MDIKHALAKFYIPMIFINTFDHSMARQDNNQDLWQREYIPNTERTKNPN